MPAKKQKTVTATEIRKMVSSSNVVIGTERTLKSLKTGKVKKIFLTSNCPEKIEDKIIIGLTIIY